jgi:hypothetical protein
MPLFTVTMRSGRTVTEKDAISAAIHEASVAHVLMIEVLVSSGTQDDRKRSLFSAIGKQAGLTPDSVEALIAGLPTSFDDSRQQVIYDLTRALIGPRVVPTGLYRRPWTYSGMPASPT